MNTPVKILLGLAGAVVLLFVALIVAVTVIIEPNDYRPYIVDAVQDSTGRRFELEGDLGLELLPCCSVSLGAARLASPDGFAEDAFASLEAASLSLKLWPLLTRREVQIGTVTLEGVDLDLIRLADGRDNWTFESTDAGAADPDGAEAAPIGLSVDGLVLRDGRLRYRDLATGADYTVTDLRLDSRLAMSGERVTISDPAISLSASGSGLPDAVRVEVVADTLIATLSDAAEVSVDAFTVNLHSLDARLRITGSGRAGTELALQGDLALDDSSPRALLAALSDDAYVPAAGSALRRLAVQGDWRLDTTSVTLQNLSVQLDDSRLTGSVAVTDFDSAATRFDLALDRIDVDGYLAAAPAGAPVAGGAAEPTAIPLDALAAVPVDGKLRIGSLRTAGVELTDLTLALTSADGSVATSLAARALNGSVKLDGGGDVGAAEPQLGGTVSVDGLSPRALLRALDADLETADPNVLQRFAGSARWRLTERSVGLQDMRWQLDDTTLTGSARIDDLDRLATRFDVAVDRLDVDAYLAPDTEPADPDEDTEIIPVEAIRGLDLSGRLRATELVLMELALRNAVAQVSAADGVLRLDPLSADLYGGTYRGTVTIDATGPTAQLSLDQELAGVQVDELLRRFVDTDLLDGSLSFKLAGSGSGNSTATLLRGLAADVSLDLSDGVYRGTDLLYQVRRARALLKNEPAPEPPAQPVTPIRTLQAAGRMVDGVLQTRRLSAETDALRLAGDGGINLLDLSLDYDLEARMTSAGAEAAKLGDLANATIPLTLSGPLSGPKVGVDLKGMITSTVRETVQQKAREALLERLGGREATTGGAGSTPADPATGAAAGTASAPAAGQPAAGEPAAGEPAAKEPAAEEPAAERPSAKELLKRGLRELLKPPPEAEPAEPESSDP